VQALYNIRPGGTPPERLLFIGVSYTSPAAFTLGDSIGVDPLFNDIAPDPITSGYMPRLMLGVAKSCEGGCIDCECSGGEEDGLARLMGDTITAIGAGRGVGMYDNGRRPFSG